MDIDIPYSPRLTTDVTDELVELTVDIVDDWYPTGRIDWEDMWDRVEKQILYDGREIDLGNDLTSHALISLKRRVRDARKES